MDGVYISVVALGLTGLTFAVILSILSKKLSVPEDVRVEKVLKALPGLNCGACGFSGCRAYAEAVVKEGKIFNGCLPGGNESNQKISEIMGLAGCKGKNARVVICHCQATHKEKKTSCIYNGPPACLAAHLTGGALDCTWGCIGYGDCEKVCPTKAITVTNRKVTVDISKCIGCGKCVAACPRLLFELVSNDAASLYYVACANKDKTLAVKKVCARGCIGCGICTRIENSAFVVTENLSRLARTKQLVVSSLEQAKLKCPTKCIFGGKAT